MDWTENPNKHKLLIYLFAKINSNIFLKKTTFVLTINKSKYCTLVNPWEKMQKIFK